MDSLKFFAIIFLIFPIAGIQSKVLTTTSGFSFYIDALQSYTWYQAPVECGKLGMAPLTVDTKAKYDEIYYKVLSEVAGIPNARFWAGSTGTNKKFNWVVTGKAVSANLWVLANPTDQNPTYNCVQFYGPSYGLMNVPCDLKRGLLCENRFQQDCCQNCAQNIAQASMSYN